MRILVIILYFCFIGTVSAEIPLSFQISAAPSAVAIQFDVLATGSPISLETPVFNGASPHFVESNVIVSGATRYIVYTTSGVPISTGGSVMVTLTTTALPQNGMLSITNVMASNAAGQQVAANPNALPVRVTQSLTQSSVPVGGSTVVSSDVIDPDGTVTTVNFKIAGGSIGTASGSSQTVVYTPTVAGQFALTVTATDSSGGQSTLDLGQLRAYSIADITNFDAFSQIHFGNSPDPAIAGFRADPFKTGIPNGLAFVLGIDPRSPDPSLMPTISVEPGNGGVKDVVFRFRRPSVIAGTAWNINESLNLSTWTAVPLQRITQTPVAGGRTVVETRLPLGPGVPGAIFNLQANPVP